MPISNDLILVSKLAKKFNIDTPYMVGGVPRDYAMAAGPIKTSDIDLTTNTPDSLRLGILLADKLNSSFKVFDDNHITLYLDKYSIDFSSNFKSESVIKDLNSRGIDDPRLYEVYSRDFSINTLHQDLITKDIIDLTGDAIADLSEGVIKTPVDPSITIVDDPRRVFRSIYFASKYGFKIDNSIIDFVKNNNDIIYSESIADKFITSKISKSMLLDSDVSIKYLRDMGILSRVPLVGFFKDFLIKNKLVIEYLDNTKYDFLNKKSQLESWSKKSGDFKKIFIGKYADADCTPLGPQGNRNVNGQNLEHQLSFFIDAIQETESSKNYAVKVQRASSEAAVGAYQILYRNWYGIAGPPGSIVFPEGYYFNDAHQKKTDGSFCDPKVDMVNNTGIIYRRGCDPCKTNECYKWYGAGDMLPDQYAWNFQALGDRNASFMIDKENEDIYLNCTSKEFREGTCSAQPSSSNQDTVASYMMGKYFKKYYCSSASGSHLDADGSNKHVWGAVATAWYAGEGQANLPHGQRSTSPIWYGDSGPWPSIKQYVEKIMSRYHAIWSSHNSNMPDQTPGDADTAPDSSGSRHPGDEGASDLPSDPNCYELVDGEYKRCEGSVRRDKIGALLKLSRKVTLFDHNPRNFSSSIRSASDGLKPRIISYVSTGGLPEPIPVSRSGVPSRLKDPDRDLNFLRHGALSYAHNAWGRRRDGYRYKVHIGELDAKDADVKLVFTSTASYWDEATTPDQNRDYVEHMDVYYSDPVKNTWQKLGSQVEFPTEERFAGIYSDNLGSATRNDGSEEEKAALREAYNITSIDAKAKAGDALAKLPSMLAAAQGDEKDHEKSPWRYKL